MYSSSGIMADFPNSGQFAARATARFTYSPGAAVIIWMWQMAVRRMVPMCGQRYGWEARLRRDGSLRNRQERRRIPIYPRTRINPIYRISRRHPARRAGEKCWRRMCRREMWKIFRRDSGCRRLYPRLIRERRSDRKCGFTIIRRFWWRNAITRSPIKIM